MDAWVEPYLKDPRRAQLAMAHEPYPASALVDAGERVCLDAYDDGDAWVERRYVQFVGDAVVAYTLTDAARTDHDDENEADCRCYGCSGEGDESRYRVEVRTGRAGFFVEAADPEAALARACAAAIRDVRRELAATDGRAAAAPFARPLRVHRARGGDVVFEVRPLADGRFAMYRDGRYAWTLATLAEVAARGQREALRADAGDPLVGFDWPDGEPVRGVAPDPVGRAVRAQQAQFDAALPELLASRYAGMWVVWRDGLRHHSTDESDAYAWAVEHLGPRGGFVLCRVEPKPDRPPYATARNAFGIR